MRSWVQRQLEDLGQLNSICSPRLHTLLRQSHGLGLWADESQKHSLRGTAVFAAYDPWDTCLRVVPNSFKYFRAAEKQGLVNFADSLTISRALLECCVHLKMQYRGHFSYFFEQPDVKAFLDCFHDRQAFLDIDNTRGACPDILWEAVPWPLQPRHHLISRTMDHIGFEPGEETFTAVNDAIDFASWGPWIGLNVDDVCKILMRLKSPGSSSSANQHRGVAGRRMIIPFFSQGFQGIVVGFFIGIDNKQSELVRTELLQFGQTLADHWSWQRFRAYSETTQKHRDAAHLSEAILQMVSPVSYVIVETGDQSEGYKLREEGSYWAGYRKLSPNEITILKSRNCEIRLVNTVSPNSTVIIKVLSDHNVLDQAFTTMRIKLMLSYFTNKQTIVDSESCSLDKLKYKKIELENRTESGPISLALRRQLFVIEKIIGSYRSGSVSITNHELLRYLKTKGNNISSGYQISSHSEEIARFLGASVRVERSRNGIQVRWVPE